MPSHFYGKVLVPPTIIEHGRVQFDLAVTSLQQAQQRVGMGDVIVCIEMKENMLLLLLMTGQS